MGWIIAIVVIAVAANVLRLVFGELFEQMRDDRRARRLGITAARRDRK